MKIGYVIIMDETGEVVKENQNFFANFVKKSAPGENSKAQTKKGGEGENQISGISMVIS